MDNELDADDIDNEQNVLCEKIIRDINAVFLKDADLSSFEIIPKETNCNKSPVIHVEHNLGLESWCAQHVYDYSHRMLITHRRQTQQQQMRILQQQQQSDMLAKYLNVALLINADVTTFWHIRRQLVQKNRLTINKELQFSALVLSMKPKSNEAFAYRRWLYSFQSADAIDWPNEISICERAADRCISNYHAWSHRQWVLQNAPCLLQSEFMRTDKFIRKHISDYSSYYYRQLLLTRAYDLCYSLPKVNAKEQRQYVNLQWLLDSYGYHSSSSSSSSHSSNSSNDQTAAQDDDELSSDAKLLKLLLPQFSNNSTNNTNNVSAQKLRSLLYCCDVAAHDIQLCAMHRSLYGARECFELHRRASLKFIVEQCVRLQMGFDMNTGLLYMAPQNYEQRQELQAQFRKFDYSANPFLSAIRKAESAMGDKHQRWCNLHLNFGYKQDNDDSVN